MDDAQLVVRRERQSVGLWRTYRVLVDGTRVARLAGGESTALSLKPGPHELRVAIDWTRSPSLGIDPRPGETIHVSCRARGNAFTATWWGMIQPRRAIQIWQTDGSSPSAPEPSGPWPDRAPVADWLSRRRSGRAPADRN